LGQTTRRCQAASRRMATLPGISEPDYWIDRDNLGFRTAGANRLLAREAGTFHCPDIRGYLSNERSGRVSLTESRCPSRRAGIRPTPGNPGAGHSGCISSCQRQISTELSEYELDSHLAVCLHLIRRSWSSFDVEDCREELSRRNQDYGWLCSSSQAYSSGSV
jgi:hypothetical protein